jgi:hypothetical protein
LGRERRRKMSKTIEVSDETFDRIKEQLGDAEIYEIDEMEDLVGKSFFFRTVTYHLVGKVVKRIGKFVELKTASWIGSSGRFMQAIKDGTLDEVEPVGTAFLNLDTVTDFFPWQHKLPTKQK